MFKILILISILFFFTYYIKWYRINGGINTNIIISIILCYLFIFIIYYDSCINSNNIQHIISIYEYNYDIEYIYWFIKYLFLYINLMLNWLYENYIKYYIEDPNKKNSSIEDIENKAYEYLLKDYYNKKNKGFQRPNEKVDDFNSKYFKKYYNEYCDDIYNDYIELASKKRVAFDLRRYDENYYYYNAHEPLITIFLVVAGISIIIYLLETYFNWKDRNKINLKDTGPGFQRPNEKVDDFNSKYFKKYYNEYWYDKLVLDHNKISYNELNYSTELLDINSNVDNVIELADPIRIIFSFVVIIVCFISILVDSDSEKRHTSFFI